jgi:chorismate mutase
LSDDPYYLIRRSHLPDVIRRTTQVAELLQHHPDMSVLEAVRQIGISRSAYYKYKQVVRPFSSAVEGQIVTMAFTLRHERGVLSEVINTLSSLGANILTINQSLPLQGIATAIISFEMTDLAQDPADALDHIRRLPGVEQAAIVGRG